MDRYRMIAGFGLAAVLLLSNWCQAGQTIYNDETAFLNALAAMGYIPLTEGFEDDGDWGDVRTTQSGGQNTAQNVQAGRLNWQANDLFTKVTTSPWVARTGDWGLYQQPHGDPLNDINDGLVVQSSSPLYGAGAWFITNTPGAAVDFIVDQDTANPVVFAPADRVLSGTFKFLGVIDTDGFTHLEIAETEGGGDLFNFKVIFEDDFTFAVAQPGDFNRDGKVEANDLALLLDNWGYGEPGNAGYPAPADWTISWDGFVDANELADLLDNWGVGLGGASLTALPTTDIPEPASMSLLALGGLALLRRRRA